MSGHLCPTLECAMSGHRSITALPQQWWSTPAMLPLPPRCPATFRHVRPYTSMAEGLQCKYTPGHEGDHAAYSSGGGDVFWPQESTAEVTA